MRAADCTRGLIVAIAFGAIGLAAPATAQDNNGYPYSIMKDERGAKPRMTIKDDGWEQPQAQSKKPVQRARGSSSPAPVPQYQSTVTPLGTVPRIVETRPLGHPASPGMIVPGVGAASGPAMTPPRPAGQSFQDRTINCVHASGVAGVAPGQVGTYTRSCVNQ